jgi:hypothetical protein
MITLPSEFRKQISEFAPLFTRKVFEHAKILLLGAILTIGRRTVCSALKVVGLSNEKQFHKYHRVLSLAKWSCFKAAKTLLMMLVECFCNNTEPLVFGIDETIERRRGPKIKAKGVYRDGVRSSKSHFVKSTGLRWICLMLLTKISWAERIWALPFFTVLAPSERYHKANKHKHRTITDWALWMIIQVKRWLPKRQLVVVGDGAYAVINFLNQVREHACLITPLMLKAQLFDFPPPDEPGKRGPKPKKGQKQQKLIDRLIDPNAKWTDIIIPLWYNHVDVKLQITMGFSMWYNSNSGKTPVPIAWVLIKDPTGEIETKALLCTDLNFTAIQIINYYLQRWSVEVTFQEVRTHLGVESQRQWSDLAITRTTPVLMGLFSIVTIWANLLHQQNLLTIKSSAWYQKSLPTFSDAITAVRQHIWKTQNFRTSISAIDIHNLEFNFLEHIIYLATCSV